MLCPGVPRSRTGTLLTKPKTFAQYIYRLFPEKLPVQNLSLYRKVTILVHLHI